MIKRILIVEDHSSSLEAMKRYLGFDFFPPEYEILTANDLLEAETILRELAQEGGLDSLDTVITDGLDGDCFGVLKTLMLLKSSCQKVVLVTGSPGLVKEKDREKLFGFFHRVFEKPVDLDKLVAICQQ